MKHKKILLILSVLMMTVISYGRERELSDMDMMAQSSVKRVEVSTDQCAPGGGRMYLAPDEVTELQHANVMTLMPMSKAAKQTSSAVSLGAIASDKLIYELYASADGQNRTAILRGWVNPDDYYPHIVVPDVVHYNNQEFPVQAIDYYAFYGGWGIEGLTLGKNVQIIGNGAFNQCNIKDLSIPASVQVIGAFSFLHNPLNSLVFENPATTTPKLQIGGQAFDWCTGSLSSVELPARISVGENSFLHTYQSFIANCNNLSTITLNPAYSKTSGNGFEIYQGALCYTTENDGHENVSICALPYNSPTTEFSITAPRIDVFQNAMSSKNLTSVILNSIEPIREGKVNLIIDNYSFEGCTSLSSLSISANGPISMSPLCAKKCFALKEYKLGDNITNIKASQGVLYAKKNGRRYLINYPNGKYDVSFVLDEDVEYIGDEAFSWNPYIKDIELSKGIKGIGNQAFYQCTSLKSVKYTGEWLTGIGTAAFTGTQLINDSNDGIVTWNDWAIYYKGVIPQNVTIPSSVKHSLPALFMGNIDLQSVTLSPNMIKVASSMFRGCYNLKEVKWPDNLIEVSAYAFESCSGLKEIHLPYSTRRIMTHAFDGCTGATSVRLGDFSEDIVPSVSYETGIGEEAFARLYNCKSLKIGKGFDKIYNRAFLSCGFDVDVVQNSTQMRSESIDNGINLIIPEGIIYIGEQAFSSANNIKYVSLPSTISQIGIQSFWLKNIPAEIVINRSTPPTLIPPTDSNLSPVIFTPGILSQSTLVFPTGTDESNFFSDTNWNFSHSEERDLGSIEDVELDKSLISIDGFNIINNNGTAMFLYSVDGRLICSGNNIMAPAKGIYILKAANKTIKIKI